MGKFSDLTNVRFGSLTALRKSGKNKNGQAIWLCLCDCSKEHTVLGTSLSTGQTKRCKECTKIWNNNRNIGRSIAVGEISGYWWNSHVLKRVHGYNSSKRNRAKKQTFDYNLTVKFGWELFLQQNKKCALTGIEIYFPQKGKLFGGTASLDRIDSSKGYVENNVQWVHKDINMMKQSYSQEYFVEMCTKVAQVVLAN